jgi:hypothetical protein
MVVGLYYGVNFVLFNLIGPTSISSDFYYYLDLDISQFSQVSSFLAKGYGYGPTVGTGQLGQTKVQIWYVIKNVSSIYTCMHLHLWSR